MAQRKHPPGFTKAEPPPLKAQSPPTTNSFMDNSEEEATRIEMPAFNLDEWREAGESESAQVLKSGAEAQLNNTPIKAPVDHSAEKTLATDSPLLHAIEEAAGERQSRHQRTWPVYVVVLLCCFLVLLIFLKFVVFSKDKTTEAEEVESESEEIAPSFAPLARKFVDIQTDPQISRIFINGVHENNFVGGISIPFAKDDDNVVAVYSIGFLPFTRYFSKDEEVENPYNLSLPNDELFKKSEITIVAPKGDNERLLTSIDGEIFTLRERLRTVMVSGVPHHIQMSHADFASHLHVYWPRKTLNEVIELPPLPSKSAAARGCKLTVNLAPEMQNQSGLLINISSKTQSFSSLGSYDFPKNEIVSIEISLPQHKTFKYAIDTSYFGSVTVDAILAQDSEGVSQIELDAKSSKDAILCFRRLAQTHCVSRKESLSLQSGRWEILVYSTETGKNNFYQAQPFRDLVPDMHYTIRLTTNPQDYKLVDIRSKKVKSN